jgi:hypothetical protein
MKNLNKLKLMLIALVSVVSISNVNAQCTAAFNYIDNGNGNYTFTSTGSGGANFYWSFGDGNNDFGTSVSNTFVNGTYNVCLSVGDSTTGCNDFICKTVTVTSGQSAPCNANLVIYPDSANPGNVVVVNYSTGNNLTYFWNFGDGNTSASQYPNYTYSTPGPFYLCLTIDDGVGCIDTYCDSINSGGIVLKQTGFTINVVSPTATGVEDQVELISELMTYPNPVKNNLIVEINLIKQTHVEVTVVDLLGNTIANISNKEMNAGTNKLHWNTSSVANGIYLLNVKTSHSLQTKKLVLNK